MIRLGRFTTEQPLIVAPMAGVSDVPFRELCMEYGADLAVAEMLSCNVGQWHSRKNRDRLRRSSAGGPEIVQIAGSDPAMMAEAARLNVATGADVIDINMGCPAKKVLQRAAGSALLKDPGLVREILVSVVRSVEVPVTLKIRTGWSREHRNGTDIARIAEDSGIQMLSVHGRTRECRFKGEAEYDTIAAIKQAVSIPVVANGDIDSAAKAKQVLQHTGADGLMIGRPAQGRPWLFGELRHFLRSGEELAPRAPEHIAEVALSHVRRLHRFYGDHKGLLFARKHLSWYSRDLPNGCDLKKAFNSLDSVSAQREMLLRYVDTLHATLNPAQEPGKERAA